MEYLQNKMKKYKYKYLRMTGGIYIIPSDKTIVTRVKDIQEKGKIVNIIKMKLEINRQYIDKIIILKNIIKSEIMPDINYIMILGQNKLYMNELKTLENLLLPDNLVNKYNKILKDMESLEIVKLYYKKDILINID